MYVKHEGIIFSLNSTSEVSLSASSITIFIKERNFIFVNTLETGSLHEAPTSFMENMAK